MKKLDLRILFISLCIGFLVWIVVLLTDYHLFSSITETDFHSTKFIKHVISHGIVTFVGFISIGIICSLLLAKQKRIEEKLRISEEILKNAERIAHVGSWHLDINRNHLIWSDEVYRIFGVTPQKFKPTYEAFLNTVHPDDRKLVDRTYNESIQSKTPYEVIHRILRPDGEMRIVQERSENLLDASGKTIHSIGMVHDITDLKNAETVREKLIDKLQKTLSEVKTLRGILPICSFCKKIRDDSGYWDRVDIYIMQHTEADFSHSVCPDCREKHYSDIKPRGSREY